MNKLTPEQRKAIEEVVDEALAMAKGKITSAILDHLTAQEGEA